MTDDIWKVLIIITLIVALVSLIININNSIMAREYEIRIIELDNNNFAEYINVVGYLCDDNRVYITNLGNFFYASTWIRDSFGGKATCALKVVK